MAFQKPGGQHRINWEEFAISRIRAGDTHDLQYFEHNDWRKLDHTDRSLWTKGVERLLAVQGELGLLGQQKNSLLAQKVPERAYSYRKLIHGILQHDMYHLGPIAYITKLKKST